MNSENLNKADLPVLSVSALRKSYISGGAPLTVLNDVSLSLAQGEVVSLVGQSGSGKSTFLHCAGQLDHFDKGQMLLLGQDVSALSQREKTQMRRNDIGFIYQFHYLLPDFSAIENVMMPMTISGVDSQAARLRAMDLLARLGLSDRAEHRPGTLSGGEQQRVAIARALANKPKLLLADEPTGNLDERTGISVFKEMIELLSDEGASAIIATHNPDLASLMSRTYRMENGQISAL